jgi:hypothetical protein
VKIELGARSDHFLIEDAKVTPYVRDVFPDAAPDADTSVRVLAAARTFWEKATILHMVHHQPADRRLAPRMSRHYYDAMFFKEPPPFEEILARLPELEERVNERRR